MFGIFRMKAALNFTFPSANIRSEQATVASSLSKKGKIPPKERQPVPNACWDRAFQGDNCLFIDLQIVSVYFCITELKHNGISVELQDSADGSCTIPFTMSLCVSEASSFIRL